MQPDIRLPSSRRFACQVATLLVLAAFRFAHAADYEIVDKPWVKATSDNFTVYTTHETDVATDLIRHLELIRFVIPTETRGVASATLRPVTIVAFDTQLDFGHFSPHISVGKALIESERGSFILLHDYRARSFTNGASGLLANIALRSVGIVPFPPWLREGFAAHVADAVVTPDNILLGRNRFTYVHWLTDLDKTVTAERPGRGGKWTTEVSAKNVIPLYQYLNFRGGREFWDDSVNYVNLLADGADRLAAFENSYAVTVSELRKPIERFWRNPDLLTRKYPVGLASRQGKQQGWSIPTDAVKQTFKISTQSLSRGEAAQLIAELAIETGRLSFAERVLNWAMEGDGTNCAIEAALGNVYRERQLFEQAKYHLDIALQSDPDNAKYLIDLGRAWYEQSLSSTALAERQDALSQATKYFVDAWELDKQNPEAYAWLGQALVVAGDNMPRGIELLETATTIRPENASVQLMLARAYRLVGRDEEAIRIAAALSAWSYLEQDLLDAADELMRQNSSTVTLP